MCAQINAVGKNLEGVLREVDDASKSIECFEKVGICRGLSHALMSGKKYSELGDFLKKTGVYMSMVATSEPQNQTDNNLDALFWEDCREYGGRLSEKINPNNRMLQKIKKNLVGELNQITNFMENNPSLDERGKTTVEAVKAQLQNYIDMLTIAENNYFHAYKQILNLSSDNQNQNAQKILNGWFPTATNYEKIQNMIIKNTSSNVPQNELQDYNNAVEKVFENEFFQSHLKEIHPYVSDGISDKSIRGKYVGKSAVNKIERLKMSAIQEESQSEEGSQSEQEGSQSVEPAVPKKRGRKPKATTPSKNEASTSSSPRFNQMALPSSVQLLQKPMEEIGELVLSTRQITLGSDSSDYLKSRKSRVVSSGNTLTRRAQESPTAHLLLPPPVQGNLETIVEKNSTKKKP